MKQLFAIGVAVLTLPILAAMALGGADAQNESNLHPVHEIHIDAEIECETCHEGAWSAENLLGILPDHVTCENCHEVDDTDECGLCHVGGDAPSGRARKTLGYGDRVPRVPNFIHAKHVGEEDEPCAACHQLQDSGYMSQPAHAECRSCHATASGFQDCTMCHGPGDPPRPDSHTSQYRAMHALDASWDQEQCQSCHTQTDCQDCHNGDNVWPRVHELNYAYSHALDARSFEFLCTTCHADPEYCVSCHVAERVYPQNHSRADWIPGQHGIEASYNIETCIACHDQGQNDPICANCHGGR